jgi:membrane-associated phospholipid phosphatase
LHPGLSTETASQPAGHQDEQRNAGWALIAGVALLVVVYGWMFVSGSRFFVMKTAVMPIFLLYALMLRRRSAFLTDWAPVIAGTVLFDALRGAIFIAVRKQFLPVYLTYTITLEHALFRVPAVPLVLQQWRMRWLDLAAVTIHASHFAFFLLFGLVLWHLRPAYFGQYRRALLLVMGMGLLGYTVVPSVPPWLAASAFHVLPPIAHTVGQVYNSMSAELYGTFDTNPVAAMPSLHAAFPTMCACVGWQAYGKRVGLALAVYATVAMFGVMYLGEHYAVDVVAGIGVGLLAVWAARRPWVSSLSLMRSLAVSGLMVALTVTVLFAFR